VEICNLSGHFRYLFLKLGNVIYLHDINMLLKKVDEQLMCFIDALKNRVRSQLWWVIDFKKTVAFAKISANNVRPAMYIMTNLFICTACMPYML